MTELNEQIILAAISAAGPVVELTADEIKESKVDSKVKLRDPITEWDQRVKSTARDIKLMLAEDSPISQQLAALDKCIDSKDTRGKIFRGTILSVTKEPSSTRAKILIHTGTPKAVDGAPAGAEFIRTERTDGPDGRALARRVQSLVGHITTVYIELQAMSTGTNKVRILQHIVDLGVDPKFDQKAA